MQRAISEERLALLEGRVMEHAVQINGTREAIARLDDKVSQHFIWIVGIQVTTLLAMVAALIGG